jgi:hypothetical protein
MSKNVRGGSSLRPEGKEEIPSSKKKSKDRTLTYMPETFHEESYAKYSGMDTMPWSSEEHAFVKEEATCWGNH